MQPVISAEQMREIDRLTTRDYQTPSLLLMQHAADACFNTLIQHFADGLAGRRARILCGTGNNGGDGAALALTLARAGVHVDLVLFGAIADSQGDARTNFESVRQLASFAASTAEHPAPLSFVECKSTAAWESLARPRRAYDVIVDALFGTGLSRPLTGIFAQVVEHLNLLRAARDRSATKRPFILAVDLPSGLNADNATPFGPAVAADVTVTFTAPKPANVLPPAADLNGRLVVANIGSPASLVAATKSDLFVTEADDAREWLVATRYTPDSFKNTHGRVLVVAGSRGYTGAAVLCGNAAMRSGAGLVTIATPASAQIPVATGAMPEVMTVALAETDRGAVSDEALEHVLGLTADVVAIGPGLSASDARTRSFVYEFVKRRKTPVVVDADGLNCLTNYGLNGWPAELQGTVENPIVLTPHPGEMRRLLGATDKHALADRVGVVRAFATRHQVVLVLKGERSLVAVPDGRVFINPTGNPGLGTAGAGDTLTGFIAGFIAQARGTLGAHADVSDATIAALYLGGLAGDLAAGRLGMRSMVASDIREHLGAAIRALDPAGEFPGGAGTLPAGPN